MVDDRDGSIGQVVVGNVTDLTRKSSRDVGGGNAGKFASQYRVFSAPSPPPPPPPPQLQRLQPSSGITLSRELRRS